MKFTILTVESRGDIQPFITLDSGLKQAGYQIRLATHANFQNLISYYRLNYVQMVRQLLWQPFEQPIHHSHTQILKLPLLSRIQQFWRKME